MFKLLQWPHVWKTERQKLFQINKWEHKSDCFGVINVQFGVNFWLYFFSVIKITTPRFLNQNQLTKFNVVTCAKSISNWSPITCSYLVIWPRISVALGRISHVVATASSQLSHRKTTRLSFYRNVIFRTILTSYFHVNWVKIDTETWYCQLSWSSFHKLNSINRCFRPYSQNENAAR